MLAPGSIRLLSLAALFAAPLSRIQAAAQDAPPPPIRDYIRTSWDSLSRSMIDCKSLKDPKVTTAPILYLPAGMAVPDAVQQLHASCGVEIEHLPRAIAKLGDLQPEALKRPGLLYLPNRYVVPGGRFNEMYGWDSYFIALGLLSDGRFDLARGMAENFFFEIQNYGALLNANRTYFLTRSQPPLLGELIREIYDREKKENIGAPAIGPSGRVEIPLPSVNFDRMAWLAKAYAAAQQDYALWISPIHQAGNTGLARYFDVGEGPVLEMADDSTYYPDVLHYLLAHREEARDYLVPASAGDAASCDQALTHVCKTAEVDGMRLSRDFYRGDRADRESGFDTTFRFGPFAGSTHHIAPVCLNSLLYKYEFDLAGFADELGHKADAIRYREAARRRKAAIDKYLWDPALATYADYDFTTAKRTEYAYASEFYPLWAGVASPKQAAQVALRLPKLEHEHGLAMSERNTGQQWDLPFGWAPVHYFAVLGLRRYGFNADADRLAEKFRTDVETNYRKEATIREKYDVETGATTTRVVVGYKANGIGFGWTNGVYLRLLPAVPASVPVQQSGGGRM